MGLGSDNSHDFRDDISIWWLPRSCIVHKLIIPQLGGELVWKNRQVELLSDHRLGQCKHRQFYWGIRAETALLPLLITVIIDGVDPSNFCYPQSEFVFTSKLLEGMQCP